MKKLLLFLILYANMNLFAQTFTIQSIDDSEYPIMKAEIFVFDSEYNPVSNIPLNDFSILENSKPSEIISIDCPQKDSKRISCVLAIDNSSSMGNSSFINARTAGYTWVDAIPENGSETAVISFNVENALMLDFSSDKDKLETAIKAIRCSKGTNFDAAFINTMAGAFLISEKARNEKVVLIITDGNAVGNEAAIIAEAKNSGATVHAIILKSKCPPILQNITQETGGIYFEELDTENEVKAAVMHILQVVQGIEPCTIQWKGNIDCSAKKEIEINYNGDSKKIYVQASENNIAQLDVVPQNINFGAITPLTSTDTTIAITAVNSDFIIKDIALDYGSSNFKISGISLPYLLNQDETINIDFTFTPQDSSYYYACFTIDTDLCPHSFVGLGGFIGKKIDVSTLELTHPNGGEAFVIDSDTLITWKGIGQDDKVLLEYSSDSGKNWSKIVDTASNLKYRWENIPAPVSDECLIRIKQYVGANVGLGEFDGEIDWDVVVGGNKEDVVWDILQTYDGGYIVVGFSASSDGDIFNEHHGDKDIWLVKFDPEGEIEWSKLLGGSKDDVVRSILQTYDGGYLITGWTYSSDGDVQSSNKGLIDCWLIKCDSDGEINWENTYGGSSVDKAYSTLQIEDGNYIVAGTSSSNDGDMENQNIGEDNYWVAEMNEFGVILWDSIYGGTDADWAKKIIPCKGGGYAIIGSTKSKDIDTERRIVEEFDFYLLRINDEGKKLWEQVYGGSGNEYANGICQTADGGFLLLGQTNSDDGDISSGLDGGNDVWMVRVDFQGNLIWEKTYGGTGEDVGIDILTIENNEYIVAATSASNDGDRESGSYGGNDSWLFKISNEGNLLWEYAYGGEGEDRIYAIDYTHDASYIIASSTNSENGVFDGRNNGSYDYWIIKTNPGAIPLQVDQSNAFFSVIAAEVAADDIFMGDELVGSTKDSIITSYIKNTGSYRSRIDTIYIKNENDEQFYTTSWDFPMFLEVGESAGLEIIFSPTGLGLQSGELMIETPTDTLSYYISGYGVDYRIETFANVIDFGLLALADNTEKDSTAFMIRNVSDLPIDITEIKQGEGGIADFTILNNPDSLRLYVGDTCTLNLQFHPNETGRKNGTVEFHYDGVGSPATVQLFGEAVNQFEPSIFVQITDFENLVCENRDTTSFSISNEGVEDLIISDFNIIGANSSEFLVEEKTPITIYGGDVFYLDVIFAPKSPGDKNAELQIISNSEPEPVVTTPLSARKDSVAIRFNASFIDLGFKEINMPVDFDFLVENTGTIAANATLTCNPIFTLSKSHVFLTPGQQELLNVHYDGSATPTSIEEEITITDNICNHSYSIDITLNITGNDSWIFIDINDYVVWIGDTLEIPIFFFDGINYDQSPITGISLEMIFNHTVLYPIGHEVTIIDDVQGYIKFDNIPLTNENIPGDIIESISFIAALGNAPDTPIIFRNARALGDPTMPVTCGAGGIGIEGICYEGGERLVHSTGKPAGIIAIAPNPASNDLSIELELIEIGYTEILIYDIVGKKVKTILSQNIEEVGERTIKVDVSALGQGYYSIIFKSPTILQHVNTMIIR